MLITWISRFSTPAIPILKAHGTPHDQSPQSRDMIAEAAP